MAREEREVEREKMDILNRLACRGLSHLNGFRYEEIREETREDLRVKIPLINPDAPFGAHDDGNYMTKRLPSSD